MQATYDSEHQFLKLMFMYPSVEPSTKTIDVQSDVQVTCGKHSGNIYRIIVQVKSARDFPLISERVEQSLKKLEAQMPAGIENFHVIARVVRENRDELLPVVVGSKLTAPA